MIRPIFDLNYVSARDALIPLAEEWTLAILGTSKGLTYYSLDRYLADWNRIYMSKMQQLAMQRGLTCGMPSEQETFIN